MSAEPLIPNRGMEAEEVQPSMQEEESDTFGTSLERLPDGARQRMRELASRWRTSRWRHRMAELASRALKSARRLERPAAQSEHPLSWRIWLGKLGMWIVHDEVKEEAARAEAEGKKITTFYFAGPALAEVSRATKWQWGFALIFPFLVVKFSSCPESHQPFAAIPSWAYFCFVPILAISFCREVRALRYMLCPCAMYCAPYRLAGGRELPFALWLVCTALIGIGSHADLLTNGLFLSKTLTTVLCDSPTVRTIETIWKHVIQASMFSWAPFADRLHCVVLLGWCSMLFQPIMLVLYGWPRQGADVTFGKCAHENGYETLWSKFWKLHPTPQENGGPTLYVMHHADILQVAGWVNRMNTITDKSLTLCLARSTELVATNREDRFLRAVEIMYKEFSRITCRLWMLNVVEKAAMLEMKITMFAISRLLMPTQWKYRFDTQMIVSIVLSFLCYAKAIYDAWDQFKAVSRFVRMVTASQPYKDWIWERGVPGNRQQRTTKYQNALSWTKISFIAGSLVMVLCASHCMAKFVMAFICRDSLWNVQLSWPEPGLDGRGCVDLSMYLHG
mmetsp:Transcript_13287/g.41983  ORF Transcript_13287/g.41983 Transcript_13287/m.41983 type:complete len:563 (-) Transcript_13287:404-2092(-)